MPEDAGTAEVGAETRKPGADLAIGATVRVARLADLKAMRCEVGRLYRECRRHHGRFPDALTGQRLANILGHVRTMLEVELLEERIVKLEARAEGRSA
ncbi:MAG: hypothetical protein WDZ66_11310 [Steroidobacteraceae bacterium]